MNIFNDKILTFSFYFLLMLSFFGTRYIIIGKYSFKNSTIPGGWLAAVCLLPVQGGSERLHPDPTDPTGGREHGERSGERHPPRLQAQQDQSGKEKYLVSFYHSIRLSTIPAPRSRRWPRLTRPSLWSPWRFWPTHASTRGGSSSGTTSSWWTGAGRT